MTNWLNPNPFSSNPSRDAVQYAVKLGDPVYEAVVISSTPDLRRRVAFLTRFGRHVTYFVPTESQVKKIRADKGTIHITTKQIESAQIRMSSAGW